MLKELINWRVATDIFDEDIESHSDDCPSCGGYSEEQAKRIFVCYDCGLEWEE